MVILLNVVMVMIYKGGVENSLVCIIIFGVLFFVIVLWFVFDNFVLDNYIRYIFIFNIVFVVVLVGLVFKNFNLDIREIIFIFLVVMLSVVFFLLF